MQRFADNGVSQTQSRSPVRPGPEHVVLEADAAKIVNMPLVDVQSIAARAKVLPT
jgi:hypothetical protein